jgi:hypothetical protein
MNLADITPLVITCNEEPNIGRCLDRLRWASRVLVIDSGSTDRTLAICAEFPNVEVLHRDFDHHTAQWNYGLAWVRSRWVLTLDADYLLNAEFVAELGSLPDNVPERVWHARFHFFARGRRLRGSLYPPRAILFDPAWQRYRQDGHTQSLRPIPGLVPGPRNFLKAAIDHDDRKPLSRWLESQRKVAVLEAEKLSQTPAAGGGLPDRLRRMIWPAAPAAFLYTLVFKGVVFDGWAGWFHVLQRTYAELLLSLALLERKLTKGEAVGPTGGSTAHAVEARVGAVAAESGRGW